MTPRHLLPLIALLALSCSDSPQVEAAPQAPAAAPEPLPPPPPPAIDPQVEARLLHVSVEIDGPLEKSLRGALDPDVAAPLSQVTARMLVWWIDVARDFRRGDRLDVVYELPPGKEPLLHAVRFFSQKFEREWRAYLHQPEGHRYGRYYDAKGVEIEERLKNSPIDEYEQVTSILRDGRGHRGVDFKAPVGSPVKMPFDAKLTRKNWKSRGNGNCLEFKDAQGRRIIFLHLDELPSDLKIGRTYRTGEVVAQSGNTGRSTAPHLHYQLEGKRGKLLDPFREHETYRASIDEDQREAFSRRMKRYDALLTPDAAPASAVADR